MSKKSGNQTVTNTPDAATLQRQKEAWKRAQGVADQGYTDYDGQRVAGANPLSQQGGAGYQQGAGQFGGLYDASMGFANGRNPNLGGLSPYDQAGGIGARALGGDAGATRQLMNPYQQQVIDRLGGQYDRMRDKSVMDVNDIATRGGAFGGDRQALLQGERLGELDRAQGDQTAQLLHGGFNDAMGRAGSAANLGLGARGLDSGFQLGQGGLQLGGYGQAGNAAQGGLGASQGLLGAGDYFRGIDQAGMTDLQNRFNDERDWGMRGLDVLNQTAGGMQSGNSQSQPLYRNRAAGALGGAATGMSVGGPIGAGIGGILGLFG